jgi:hypothetical protein
VVGRSGDLQQQQVLDLAAGTRSRRWAATARPRIQQYALGDGVSSLADFGLAALLLVAIIQWLSFGGAGTGVSLKSHKENRFFCHTLAPNYSDKNPEAAWLLCSRASTAVAALAHRGPHVSTADT